VHNWIEKILKYKFDQSLYFRGFQTCSKNEGKKRGSGTQIRGVKNNYSKMTYTFKFHLNLKAKIKAD